jgi:hypothetical protein
VVPVRNPGLNDTVRQGTWIWSFGIFLWSRQESNLDLELRKLLYYPLYDEAYLISPGALLVKIFTAMASNITPKNLRITSIPPEPNMRSI